MSATTFISHNKFTIVTNFKKNRTILVSLFFVSYSETVKSYGCETIKSPCNCYTIEPTTYSQKLGGL